jgi:hypothetical protein
MSQEKRIILVVNQDVNFYSGDASLSKTVIHVMHNIY